MVFWLAGILLLLKISRVPADNSTSVVLWSLFGAVAGLCIMSKVHGFFLWITVALCVLFRHSNWLKHWGIYLAAAITLIIISPIVIWNIQNNFVSYTYHGNRISITGAGINTDGFAREIFGEILYNNPVNFFLIAGSLFSVVKPKLPADKNKDVLLLLFCSLPLIVVLLFISLFKDTLPHWSCPAYCCLLFLPAIKLASDSNNNRLNLPVAIKAALTFIIILTASGIIIINFYPGTLSNKKEGLHAGAGDVTLDMYGWEDAGKRFDSLYKDDVEKKVMPAGSPIIITKWFPAAHIEFYIINKTGQETYGIGNIFDLHQYYWSNKYKKQLNSGDDAYFVIPSNLYNEEDIRTLNDNFKHHEPPVLLFQKRHYVLCKEVLVFRFKGYCG